MRVIFFFPLSFFSSHTIGTLNRFELELELDWTRPGLVGSLALFLGDMEGTLFEYQPITDYPNTDTDTDSIEPCTSYLWFFLHKLFLKWHCMRMLGFLVVCVLLSFPDCLSLLGRHLLASLLPSCWLILEMEWNLPRYLPTYLVSE